MTSGRLDTCPECGGKKSAESRMCQSCMNKAECRKCLCMVCRPNHRDAVEARAEWHDLHGTYIQLPARFKPRAFALVRRMYCTRCVDRCDVQQNEYRAVLECTKFVDQGPASSGVKPVSRGWGMDSGVSLGRGW